MPRFSAIPIILLTATATQAKLKVLKSTMCLNHPVEVISNPNRANIKMTVLERPPSTQTKDHLDSLLVPISEALRSDPMNFPLTIVYAHTRVIGYCYRYLEKALGDEQYIGAHVPSNRIFGQCHAEYPDDMKKLIVEELCQEFGKLRLVFASPVLGMGLNAKYVREVIHYQAPKTLENYFQEIGRAGRDGEEAHATIFYNSSDVKQSTKKKHRCVDAAMKQFCLLDSCRREFVITYFGHKLQEKNPSFCCDQCDQENCTPGNLSFLQRLKYTPPIKPNEMEGGVLFEVIDEDIADTAEFESAAVVEVADSDSDSQIAVLAESADIDDSDSEYEDLEENFDDDVL